MQITYKRSIPGILSIVLVLGLFLTPHLTQNVAALSGATSVAAITISGGNAWSASGTTIDGSISNNTSTTANSDTLTIQGNSGLGDTSGELSFKYYYELTGGYGVSTGGSASISGFASHSQSGDWTGNKSQNVTADNAITYTVPNWSKNSSLTITLSAAAGYNKGIWGGAGSYYNSSAAIHLIEISFIPYNVSAVNFERSSIGYIVSYYANAEDTTENSTTVSSLSDENTEPEAISAVESRGVRITPTDTNYHCVALAYTKPDGTSGILHADAAARFYPESDWNVIPRLVYDANGTAPFKVNGGDYWTWETAFVAANSSTKTVTLNDSYVLPGVSDTDILTRNGLTEDGSYVDFTMDSKGTVTDVIYKVPSGFTFHIPYDSSFTGLKDSIYPQVLTLTDVNPAASDFPSHYSRGTLTASKGTTIASNGTFIINGKQMGATWQFTGSACGPHGLVKLTDSTSKLHIQSGTLYCYGYVTGSGTVEVNKNAIIYELLQLRDWRGFTASASWMGANVNTADIRELISRIDDLYALANDPVIAQKNHRSFIFSQYYVQNVESTLKLNVGAKLNTVLTTNTKKDTPQEVIPFVTSTGNNGFLQLDGSGALYRDYDAATDRITYTIDCNATTGSIKLTFGVSLTIDTIEIDLDTIYNILALNQNMTIKVKANRTLTVVSDLKMLPETIVEVEQGGNLVIDSAEFFIYDKQDWTDGNYSYNYDMHQLHYSATRAGAPVSRGIDESAKLIINGTLTINSGANIFTTAGHVRNGASAVADRKTADKVITSTMGTGMIINRSAVGDKTGALDEFEFGTNNWTVAHQITTIPFVSKLKGGDTPYNSLATATYYSLSNNFWYNWKVSAVDENGNSADNLVTLTSTAAADSTAGDKIVGYVSNYWNGTANAQSPFTFKVADGYGVSVNDEIQTPVDGIYTLSNIAADTTLKLHPHDWTTATCVSKSKCTICGQETGELDTDNHSFTDYQRNDDGSYTATCDYGCGQTDTITNPTAPVSLAAIQLSAEAEVVLRLKVTTDSSFNGTIVLTEEVNEVAKDENETIYTVTNGVISGVKMETVNGTTRYVLEQGIAAGEMTGDVTLEVFDSGNNRCYVYDYKAEGITPVLTRTVVDYVDLALASSNAELIELVKRMAIYGGYAQQNFGVDTSNLAYRNLPGLDALKTETETLTVGSIADNVTWSQVSAAAMAMLLGEDLEETVETEPTEAPEVTVPDTTEPAAPTVPETTEPTESTETEPVATTEATIPTDPTETSATESTEPAATEGVLVDVQEIMPNVMNSGAVAEETEPAETAVPALNFMMELTAVKAEAAAEPIIEKTIPAETVAVETIPEETVITPLETIPAETIAEETEPEMPILFEETLSAKLPSSILLNDGTTVSSLDAFGLEYYKQSVVLDSRIALKTSFRMSSQNLDLSQYTFHLTYAKGGVAVEEPKLLTVTSENVVMDTDDNGTEFYKCVVKIEDIPVAYWDFDYIITVTDASGNSYALQTSVLAWVKECINAYTIGKTTLKQANMAKAMYFYNQAANDYFKK